MLRTLPYLSLFLVATLSQVFVFDSLSTSVYFAPLVYIVFIVLLPVETSRIMMLGAGVLTGYVMDVAMGTDGLNSIATIAVAYLRTPILKVIAGKKRAAERGVPSDLLFGEGDYIRYLAVMVFLHHVIFFAFESLSIANLFYSLLRFLVSGVASALFVWLIARLFSINNILK
ncbi:MAG: rod shape-determining protein MreD [Rikenellaceae bacterium]